MIKGFKMKLFPGMEAEYERRHNLLWTEMKEMIHEHGGKNYTIFLDRETLTLFGMPCSPRLTWRLKFFCQSP